MSRLQALLDELCPDGVEYKPLGSIASISRGGNFQKKDFQNEGVPCIHYGQIYTQYGLFVEETLKYISAELSSKQRMAATNDIIMAVTSENMEDVCKCVAWLGKGEVAVSGHTAIIRHNQNAKYLTYYFHTEMFASQKKKLAHGTKVIEVTPDTLVNVIVPIPPPPVQAEIVRILDAFTELTDKLSAELIARRKQYEYYRDLLLSFDNVAITTPPDSIIFHIGCHWVTAVTFKWAGMFPKDDFARNQRNNIAFRSTATASARRLYMGSPISPRFRRSA